MEGDELTRAELAARIGLSAATVRKWEVEFRPWLRAQPGTRGVGQPQTYGPEDQAVFAAVAELRRAGHTIEETKQRLDHHLATTARPLLPSLPEEGAAAASVSVARYLDVARALEAAEASAAAITEERDYLRRRLLELEAQLIEAAAARATAEERARILASAPPSLWRRLFGSRAAD